MNKKTLNLLGIFCSLAKLSGSDSLKLSHARRERELAQTRSDFIIKMSVNAVFDALSIYVGSTKCLDTALSINVVKVAVTMRVVCFRIQFSQ